MKSNAIVLLIASTILLNIGCSEIDNLHAMKDSTETMKDTTNQLDKKTETMVQTTAHLDGTSTDLLVVTNELHKSMIDMFNLTQEMKIKTSKMVDIGLEAGSLDLRAKILERMTIAESVEKKLLLSAQYFSSFDFQLWTIKDFPETERMFWAQKNAKEFILEAVNLIDQNGKFEINPEAPALNPAVGNQAPTKNPMSTLNALAAAMHYLGPDQEKLLAENVGLKEMNMYSMTLEALRIGRNLQMSEAEVDGLDGYVKEILYYPKIAENLLQARHNMLIAMALKKCLDGSGVKHPTLAGVMGWTLNLNGLKPDEVKRIKLFLQYAIQTKKDIISLGIKPEYYKKAFGINASKLLINKMLVGTETSNTKLANEVIALLKAYNNY